MMREAISGNKLGRPSVVMREAISGNKLGRPSVVMREAISGNKLGRPSVVMREAISGKSRVGLEVRRSPAPRGMKEVISGNEGGHQ